MRGREVNSLKNIVTPENRGNLVLFLILALSGFLYVWGIGWGLPSLEGWAPDELIPSEVLKGIKAGFSNGWFDKYPPFHYYILTLFYSPFLLLQSLNILNFEKLEDYTLLFYASRSASVIMAVGTVFLVYACGREIYDQKRALFAAAIAAFICPTLYYAKLANLEVPYIFWFVLSLFFYLRILKKHKLSDYVGFAIAAVISICTKDQAYAFYVLTPLFIIYHHHLVQKPIDKNAQLIDSFRDKKVRLALIVGLVLFALLHNWLFNITGFAAHVKLIVAGGARSRPQFEMSLPGQLQMLFHSLAVQTRFAFGWPMYLVGMVGLASALLKNQANRLLLYLLIPAVSYYIFYVALMVSNDQRFLLPLFVMVSWFGGKLIGDLLESDRKFHLAKILLVISLFTYTILYSSSLNLLMVDDSRYFVEKWMSKNIDKQALVLGVGNSKYLPRTPDYNFVNFRRPSVDEFVQIKPTYVITTSAQDIRRYKETSKEYEFFLKLAGGELGYKMILNYRSYPPGNLLNYEELLYRENNRRYIYSNFDKINPEIKIYKKVSASTGNPPTRL